MTIFHEPVPVKKNISSFGLHVSCASALPFSPYKTLFNIESKILGRLSRTDPAYLLIFT